MQVLIIKISSMGDVVHTLPALTDAMSVVPNINFDWVVDPAFKEIPAWHPAVNNVISAPLRAWQKNLLQSLGRKAMTKFITNIRKQKYDVIIDAQGLLKSAIIARIAKGSIYAGLNAASAREPIASMLYKKKFFVPLELHAIMRVRQLFAEVFNYSLADRKIDYGVDWAKFPSTKATKPYLFFLHGTTWKSKHWPEIYWRDLAEIAGKQGYEVYMTWATAEQRARVERLAMQVSAINMLPHLSITEAVMHLQGAKGVVAVDTGFGHLASAIGKPVVSLYGPTDPNRVGMLGKCQVNLTANMKCSPCFKKTCTTITDNVIKPACFASITPQMVWETLVEVIA